MEYKVSEGSQRAVDYDLLDDIRNSSILVEAKRIDGYSDDVESLEQIYGYIVQVETAKVIVSTNGQYWNSEVRGDRFPRNEHTGRVAEDHRPLDLHWRDGRETAERLQRHLDKSRYRKGQVGQEPKSKPRWDVHLRYIGNRAASLAGVLRPLIAGRCGSDA